MKKVLYIIILIMLGLNIFQYKNNVFLGNIKPKIIYKDRIVYKYKTIYPKNYNDLILIRNEVCNFELKYNLYDKNQFGNKSDEQIYLENFKQFELNYNQTIEDLKTYKLIDIQIKKLIPNLYFLTPSSKDANVITLEKELIFLEKEYPKIKKLYPSQNY